MQNSPHPRQPVYAGIDVAKATFEVALPGPNKHHHFQCSNNEKGFRELLSKLPADSICVMEASGVYYLKLACFLHAHDQKVSVVNPLSIKRYAQMLLARTKTDKVDARIIAQYGLNQQPALWQPATVQSQQMGQEQALMELYKKQRTALSNYLEALLQHPSISQTALASVENSIRELEGKMEELERSMDQNCEAEYGEVLRLLQSIPGIGRRSARRLAYGCKGFKGFGSAKQLASYVGLCPGVFESGSSVRRRSRIVKMGQGGLRSTLYVCAWSACRYNEVCRALYERLLAKGMPKVMAMVAVAHKLLRQAFGVVNSGVPFDPART